MMNHENSDKQGIWRILDANRNRATEACRVIEEHCRFQLDSSQHSETIKRVRHMISAVVVELAKRHPRDNALLAARDTVGDVGTTIDANDEFSKSSIKDLLAANFSRLQQSLRVLEEYTKLIDGTAAMKLETARYESYTLQKALNHVAVAREKLADCRLCVLTDAADSEDAFAERMSMLVGADVQMIQLREKNLESRELLARAQLARKICHQGRSLLIINDRPDVCLLSDADGVHVGQTDFSVRDARRIVGSRIVGVSTHSVEQAEKAVHEGADYIGIGPIFHSTTKTFDQLNGCELMKNVSDRIALPGFAIGGIESSNVEEVLEHGGRRIAVSGAVLHAAEPVRVVQELLERLSRDTNEVN